MRSKIQPDQIGGLLSVGMGGVVCLEAWRIYRESGQGIVGDHTLPALLGVLLFVLGVRLWFRPKHEPISFPRGSLLRQMVGCMIAMFLYGFFIPLIGYVVSTFSVAILLFRVIGAYGWPRSLIYSLVLSSFLYLLFIVGLSVSFPRGLLV